LYVKIDSAYLKEMEKLEVPQEKRYLDFSDADLRGFKARKNYGGTISFIVAWKIRKKREEVVIGKYPTMTPENARVCATVMLAEKLKNRRVSVCDDDAERDKEVINAFMNDDRDVSKKAESRNAVTPPSDGQLAHADDTPPRPKKKGRFASLALGEAPVTEEEKKKVREEKIINSMGALSQASVRLRHIGTKRDEEFRTEMFRKIQKESGDNTVLEAANEYLEVYNKATEGLMGFEKIDCIKDANFVLRNWLE